MTFSLKTAEFFLKTLLLLQTLLFSLTPVAFSLATMLFPHFSHHLMVFKLTPNFTNTDPGSVFPANASPRNAEYYTGLRLMPRKKQIHDTAPSYYKLPMARILA